MPARIIEELQDRKKEKVMSFLTFENIVATLIFFMPAFAMTSQAPGVVRIIVCVIAVLVGYFITIEWNGMAVYERLIWSVRGMFRLRLRNRITPEDLPSTVVVDEVEHPIPLMGPIAPVQRENPLTPLARGRRFHQPVPLVDTAAADQPLSEIDIPAFVVGGAASMELEVSELVRRNGHHDGGEIVSLGGSQ